MKIDGEIGTGRFGSGFLAGGVSSFAPVPIGGQPWEKSLDDTIIASALGGVGSVLGGGKFQNGAITAAYAYVFNDIAHALNGTEANYALGRYLNQRDDATWIVNRGSFWDMLLGGRPDLVSSNGETFEIKTDYCLSNESCTNSANAQLSRYIENSAGKLEIGNNFTVFRGAPNIWAYGSVLGVDVSYIFDSGPNPGLIGYSTFDSDNIFSQIWDAFRQRRSAPGPTFPFSLPIPAIP